ncbi:MAG: YicC family protein, partial [Clostridia bacterium]|nr:YicC family protein [Clostridia bacterium]
MLKSMTGYGRHVAENDKRQITVEIHSINHRYLDLTVKTPRVYSFLEDAAKKKITQVIARGKVDVYIGIKDKEDNSVKIALNNPIVSGYINAAKDAAEKFGIVNDLTASAVLRLPDALLIDKDEPDTDEITAQVMETLTAALEAYDVRLEEGNRLCSDILYRAGLIAEMVDFVEGRSPDSVEEYRRKIAQRMTEILGDTDIAEQRILTEAALFADKVSVTEEIVRLRSHLKQLNNMINGTVPSGRKLDFLVQEINREANTIGSKASDYP